MREDFGLWNPLSTERILYMNNTGFIAAGTSLAIIVLFYGGIALARAFAVKRKLNVQGALDAAQQEVPVFEQVAAVLESLLPAPYKALAALIATAVKKAVEVAEELWKSGTLTEDQRKAKATELVNAALEMEKVQVTDKIANAVSLAIDLAAILFLPKSHTVAADANAAAAAAAETTTAA